MISAPIQIPPRNSVTRNRLCEHNAWRLSGGAAFLSTTADRASRQPQVSCCHVPQPPSATNCHFFGIRCCQDRPSPRSWRILVQSNGSHWSGNRGLQPARSYRRNAHAFRDAALRRSEGWRARPIWHGAASGGLPGSRSGRRSVPGAPVNWNGGRRACDVNNSHRPRLHRCRTARLALMAVSLQIGQRNHGIEDNESQRKVGRNVPGELV